MCYITSYARYVLMRRILFFQWWVSTAYAKRIYLLLQETRGEA